MTKDSYLVMDRLWRIHGDDQAWVFCAHPSQFGDFFLSLSLFQNFRFRHGDDQDMRVLVATPGHHAIARLFEHLFTSVHFAPDLAGVHVRDVQEWAMVRGRARFGPGGLIWVHPFYFGFPQYEIGTLINRGRASYPDLCRLGYRLGFELAASPPRVTGAMREAAEALARQHGIEPGRSVVLFPYARSIRQESTAHLAAFAKQAKAEGYHVVTSVAGEERPIVGTPGVFIPFHLLIPFCELAGNAVAIMSGIGDILASAQCNKLLIYANSGDIDLFSVVDYELGGNSSEVAFDFSHGSIDDFLGFFPRIHTPAYAERYNAVPLPVQRYIAAHRAEVRAEMSLGDPGYVHTFGKYRGVGGIVLGNGWSGLEGWGAWSAGFRAFVYIGNAWVNLANEDGSPPDLILHLDMTPAVNDRHREQRIRVSVGEVACDYRFVAGDPLPDMSIRLPAAMTREPCVKLVIDIETPHPPSVHPTDPRPLGVGLIGIRIALAPPKDVGTLPA